MVYNFKNAWKEQDSALWLVFLRIIIGVEWLQSGIKKLIGGSFASGMEGTLTHFASGNPNAWYASLINSVFLPNAETFGWIIMIAEILVGLGLVFGLFINLSSAGSMFMNLNFYFAAGFLSPSTASVNAIMFFAAAILLVSSGSKAASLDMVLAHKYKQCRGFFINWFGIGIRGMKKSKSKKKS